MKIYKREAVFLDWPKSVVHLINLCKCTLNVINLNKKSEYVIIFSFQLL